MQWSFSRVDCFNQCPHKFRLRYIDKIEIMPSDEADNALILGTALHTGIEKGLPAAIDEYWGAFYIITDRPYWKNEGGGWKYISDHITEQIKLEYLIPKARAMLPDTKESIHEMQIATSDFIGYADLLVPTGEPNEYDLYDFKYTKSGARYRDSPQLHIYKHFLESQGKRIRNMYYLITPKVKMIKIGKTEELADYRAKITAELQRLEPSLMEIDFDYRNVTGFLLDIKKAQEAIMKSEYTKNETRLCDWCEYQAYCQKGIDLMLTLPQNKPVKQTRRKKTIWVYGEPYTGKTTFASQFPNHLFLTTDGNIRELMTYAPDEKPPNVEIRDIVTVEGRITKRKFAWEVFLEAISALETQDNPFDTIVLDHLGELYDHCRLFIFDRERIIHETDEGFGKGWDLVKTEYLSNLRRLVNLDYENIILISHEDRTKDITKKGGDKITAIKPKLRDAFLSNIAGMVDITARTLSEDGQYSLSFKTSEVIFGGGRLNPQTSEIPLDYSEFLKLYAVGEAPKTATTDKPPEKERRSRRAKETEAPPTDVKTAEDATFETEPETADDPDETESNNTGQVYEGADDTADEEEPPNPVRTRRKRGNTNMDCDDNDLRFNKY